MGFRRLPDHIHELYQDQRYQGQGLQTLIFLQHLLAAETKLLSSGSVREIKKGQYQLNKGKKNISRFIIT